METLNSIEILVQGISDFLTDPTNKDLLELDGTTLIWDFPLNTWEYYITYSEHGIEGIKTVLIDLMVDSLNTIDQIDEVKMILEDLQSSIDICWGVHGSNRTTIDTVYEIPIECAIINGSDTLKTTPGEIIKMINDVIEEVQSYLANCEVDPDSQTTPAKNAPQQILWLNEFGIINHLRKNYKSDRKISQILSVLLGHGDENLRKIVSDMRTGNGAKNDPYNETNRRWAESQKRKIGIL